MAEDFLLRMCKDIKRWINHSKEGHRRHKDDIDYYEKLWIFFISIIRNFESKDELDEYEKDFLEMVKYEGKLQRVHKKYDKKKEYYGIEETEHFLSWTKSDDITDIYWVYDTMKFIVIEGNTTSEVFGIDLTGFQAFVRKYHIEDFVLGSPAILKEKEVVFPIRYKLIKNIYENNGNNN